MNINVKIEGTKFYYFYIVGNKYTLDKNHNKIICEFYYDFKDNRIYHSNGDEVDHSNKSDDLKKKVYDILNKIKKYYRDNELIKILNENY